MTTRYKSSNTFLSRLYEDGAMIYVNNHGTISLDHISHSILSLIDEGYCDNQQIISKLKEMSENEVLFSEEQVAQYLQALLNQFLIETC